MMSFCVFNDPPPQKKGAFWRVCFFFHRFLHDFSMGLGELFVQLNLFLNNHLNFKFFVEISAFFVNFIVFFLQKSKELTT